MQRDAAKSSGGGPVDQPGEVAFQGRESTGDLPGASLESRAWRSVRLAPARRPMSAPEPRFESLLAATRDRASVV
jgi:hypothetical protein